MSGKTREEQVIPTKEDNLLTEHISRDIFHQILRKLIINNLFKDFYISSLFPLSQRKNSGLRDSLKPKVLSVVHRIKLKCHYIAQQLRRIVVLKILIQSAIRIFMGRRNNIIAQ